MVLLGLDMKQGEARHFPFIAVRFGVFMNPTFSPTQSHEPRLYQSQNNYIQESLHPFSPLITLSSFTSSTFETQTATSPSSTPDFRCQLTTLYIFISLRLSHKSLLSAPLWVLILSYNPFLSLVLTMEQSKLEAGLKDRFLLQHRAFPVHSSTSPQTVSWGSCSCPCGTAFAVTLSHCRIIPHITFCSSLYFFCFWSGLTLHMTLCFSGFSITVLLSVQAHVHILHSITQEAAGRIWSSSVAWWAYAGEHSSPPKHSSRVNWCLV